MADTKTSLEAAASALDGTELVRGVQGGVNVKLTTAQIKTLASASPTLVTPTLGVATATSINKVTITAPASAATITIANNKTLTASNTLTLTGTDNSSVNLGAGGTATFTSDKLSAFAATTSLELKGVLSDETGSGALVFATSPTLVTPALGTPASGVLTNCSGLPAAGVVGTAATLANKLGDFAATTSLELKGVLSDETGSGALVFATSPTLVTPTLGVASATSINGVSITAAHGAGEITVIIDGGGVAITTGILPLSLEIPFACTITAARLLADQSGSIVIDIWKDTYANYPPTVADTIVASAKPTLSSATKSEDTTLTGWTTSLSAGDILKFKVDSITTITYCTLSLRLSK